VRFTSKLAPVALPAVLLLAACGGNIEPTATTTATLQPTPQDDSGSGPSNSLSGGETSAVHSDEESSTGMNLYVLLTTGDVEASLPEFSSLTTSEIDYYAMIQASNPEQVVGMNAFAGLVFQSNGTASVTLSVVDFESVALAEAHLTTSSPGLEPADIEGSDDAYAAQGGDLIAVLSRSGNYVVSINGSGLPDTSAALDAGASLLALALSRLP
jgi:hypothetical protein